MLKEVYNYTDQECAQVCGCHEHMENTTRDPSVLALVRRSVKKISCALRLTRIQTTKIPRIKSQMKLSRTQHVRNNVHSTSFAQHAVPATPTHNQLTQGSIQIPLRYHAVITLQKNQSGSNSISLSTVRFVKSQGTTIPHARRNVFSLATGNTFVPKSALFPFDAIHLICSPLANNLLQP